MTYVALLRGINVGGKNKLPMADLRNIFEAAGATDVRTHIQSGNVVFVTRAGNIKRLPDAITTAIFERLKLTVPVILRTGPELIALRNPFGAAAEPSLHVMFLAEAPTKAALALLDPKRSPPDEFKVNGREIYLHCPNGIGVSKLTNAYFDSKLATTSTCRNWRTVLALRALI